MIALITPTGARPAQFAMCCQFMQRQTYCGAVTWLIVDDAHPRTTDCVGEGFKPGWTIIKVYPLPLWSGQNTQARNLTVGLTTLLDNYAKADIEAIFIIEDDDYYRPVYIERMLARLGDYWAAGEVNTIYYNVQHRRYADNNNRQHTSLFQLAFKVEAIPTFQASLVARFIDAHFCMLMDKTKLHLFNEGTLAVGMKGMPGRRGIGAGHTRMDRHPQDANMNFLRSLIGEEDAKLYERYYGYYSVAQHDILTKKRL